MNDTRLIKFKKICEKCGTDIGKVHFNTKYCDTCREEKKCFRGKREGWYRNIRQKFLEKQKTIEEDRKRIEEKHQSKFGKIGKIILEYYYKNGWKIITHSRNIQLENIIKTEQLKCGLTWLNQNGYIETNTDSTCIIKHDEYNVPKKYAQAVLEYCRDRNWKTITQRKKKELKNPY